MSTETTFEEEGVSDALPWAELQESQTLLADWARQINERERASLAQQQASSGKPAAGGPRLKSHFGRHRHDD